MPNQLIIEGIPPYDGVHEFEDFDSFTNRELHRIKKMTGLRQGEFDEALAADDNDLTVALAVIVLERAGKEVVDDLIWDADSGALRFDLQQEEAEDPTQEGPRKASDDSETRTSDEPSSSGNGSSESSDHLESVPSPIGVHALPKSVTSVPETSAS